MYKERYTDCYNRSETTFWNGHSNPSKLVNLNIDTYKAESIKRWKLGEPLSRGEVYLDIEEKFNELAEKWFIETAIFSTTTQKVLNDFYLAIIALGKAAVPLILKHMQIHRNMHWHTALKSITQANPVPNDELDQNTKVVERWVTWGKENYIIY